MAATVADLGKTGLKQATVRAAARPKPASALGPQSNAVLLPLLALAMFVLVSNTMTPGLAADAATAFRPVDHQELDRHLAATLVADHVIATPPPVAAALTTAYPSQSTEESAIDRAQRLADAVRPTRYAVQPGDTLSTIAERFELAQSTLKYANKIGNIDHLQLGQVLAIPAADLTAGELAAYQATEKRALAAAGPKTAGRNGRGGILTSGDGRISVADEGWVTPLSYSRIARGLGYGHQGIDYDAPTGTPVYSSCSGTVVGVGAFGAWNGGFGNNIVISCGGGITMRYAHLSAYSRAALAGGGIDRGQQVGAVGSTGNSTGPHLHFQVERGGVPFDPGLR